MSRLHVIDGNKLTFDGITYHCSIGANGFTSDPKEGDKATPLGEFALRECWYRPDRITAPKTSLKLRALSSDDGWCDDPKHPLYNTHIKTPFAASHEQLWREDHTYDIIVPLGFNDAPVVAGLGSAIFFHLAKPEYTPTLGCIAVSLEDMLKIVEAVEPNSTMLIKQKA